MEFSIISVLIIFSFFLLNHTFNFFSFSHIKLPLPPGTMGWPYIGETYKLYSKNPSTFFASKIKKYGSVFKTYILGCRCVMISSPEAVKTVLVSKAHLFKPTYPASKERMLGKQAIFFQQGEYHTKLRKLVLRAFMPELLNVWTSPNFASALEKSISFRKVSIFSSS